MRLAGWLLITLLLVALSIAGGGIGYYGAKLYRARTAACKPCEARATAPGMGVSNP